jgi:GLPGLI family protein
MKNILLLITLSLFSITNAQKDFQGMAVYESKTSTSDFKSRFEGNKEITPEMKSMIEERMKRMFEKTYILNFDKTGSLYKEEEKLEAPGQSGQGGFRMMSNMMGNGIQYKNVKEKTVTIAKEFMSKEFLIKDSLTTYKWQMTSETRMIGGYNCFKATAVVPVNQSDFRNYRMKKKEEKKEETKTEEKPRTTNFMDDVEIPKEMTITAWYAPEIPINQGPEGYWGLPGLILEVNDGKTTILCSKVVLNTKDKVEIKAPSNGKIVTQKEYDKIVSDKMEEWRETGGNGMRGGGMRMGR